MAANPDGRWYFTREQLLNSPSQKCQIDPEKELSYRQQAANLIQDMGQRLQVNQLCINTAIVYMHRFYVFHSFTKFQRNSIAAAALFLAAKVEEQPHKLEYVIRVHHACLHRGGPVLDTKSEAYLQQAQDLVFHESILLQTLGFEVAVDHPHTHVVKCTQMIRGRFKNAFGSPSKDLAQTSYFMATNSLHLTTFCLQYKPTVVACVCIYLVAKWCQWEIMKSSDGKNWWEYVDPSVTKELLDELTKEFLRIFDACPSRLKRRISNEKMPVMQPHNKKARSKDNSSTSSKLVPSSAASVSSIDSGLPGSSNSESSINTQEGSAQQDLSSLDMEVDRPGLYDINMGLPMVDSAMFPLDNEYASATSYTTPGSDSKLLSSQSDSDHGRSGDQHPVKKSLKEYRERQKERERQKSSQHKPGSSASKREEPARTSHADVRSTGQINPKPSGSRENANVPHSDSKHKALESQKPEVRHESLEWSVGQQAKVSGKQTADLRPSREQKMNVQHSRPHDVEGRSVRSASALETKTKNSLDRKQKEAQRNGLETKDQSALPRIPGNAAKVQPSAVPPKPNASSTQRHHADSQKAQSLEKGSIIEPLVKPSPGGRPIKSEPPKSHPRPENQAVHLKPRTQTNPEMHKLPKPHSTKLQRPDTPKVPSHDRQKTVLSQVAHVEVEQRPNVSVARKTGPQGSPVVSKTETVKVEKIYMPSLSKAEPSKVLRQEEQHAKKTEVLKVTKSETGTICRTESTTAKSPRLAKVKGAEVPKSHKVETVRSAKAEVQKSIKVESEIPPKPEPDLLKSQRADVARSQSADTLRASKTHIPQTHATDRAVMPTPEKVPGTAELTKSDSQKVLLSQPPRQEVVKKQRTKTELKQTPKPPSKPQNVQVSTPAGKLERSPKRSTPVTSKATPHKPQNEAAISKPELGKLDVAASAIKPAARRRSQTPPAAKPKTPSPKPTGLPPQKPGHQSQKTQQAVHMSDGLERPKSHKLNKVTPPKSNASSDKTVKPTMPISQRSSTSKLQISPAAASAASAPATRPALVAPAASAARPAPAARPTPAAPVAPAAPAVVVSKPEAPKASTAGKATESKVVWEPIIPPEVLKSLSSDQAADSESAETDIDELINAHMAEFSKNQQELDFLEPKPSLPEIAEPIAKQPKSDAAAEVREKRQDREERTLPKSYREKESHHRKRHTDEHRSKNSGHKHRLVEHRKGPPSQDPIPSPVKQKDAALVLPKDGAPSSVLTTPHSILTTNTGIRLKIKGLTNRNEAPSPEPSQQQATSSPLRMKLNISKIQANSEPHRESEEGGGSDRERSSSSSRHHHHHGHHKHHKHRHKSRSGERSQSHRRKRSLSRSDSMSSGKEGSSPVVASPMKRRAYAPLSAGYQKSESLIPIDQSLLRFPMPPDGPAKSVSSRYTNYSKHDAATASNSNSLSAASTGQLNYNVPGFHQPLTTVTALPSSEGFSFYSYGQASDCQPPPPPPPRDDRPPPPPPSK